MRKLKIKLKSNHTHTWQLPALHPPLPNPGTERRLGLQRRLWGRGYTGALVRIQIALGLGTLSVYRRNYLSNKENNSMCFNSCFREKSSKGKDEEGSGNVSKYSIYSCLNFKQTKSLWQHETHWSRGRNTVNLTVSPDAKYTASASLTAVL